MFCVSKARHAFPTGPTCEQQRGGGGVFSVSKAGHAFPTGPTCEEGGGGCLVFIKLGMLCPGVEGNIRLLSCGISTGTG